MSPYVKLVKLPTFVYRLLFCHIRRKWKKFRGKSLKRNLQTNTNIIVQMKCALCVRLWSPMKNVTLYFHIKSVLTPRLFPLSTHLFICAFNESPFHNCFPLTWCICSKKSNQGKLTTMATISRMWFIFLGITCFYVTYSYGENMPQRTLSRGTHQEALLDIYRLTLLLVLNRL